MKILKEDFINRLNKRCATSIDYDMIKPKKVKGIKYKIFNKETKQYELNMLLLPDESFNFFKIESGQYGEFKGRYINIENCDKYEVHYTCI